MNLRLTNSLQYPAQDEVCQSQPVPLQFSVQPPRCWVFAAAQLIDPQGGVDNNHRPALRSNSTQAGLVKIAIGAQGFS